MKTCAYRNRNAAWAVTALAVLCVLALCWIFFAEIADHDCVGKDCPVCARLAEIRSRIRTLTEAGRSAAAVILLFACARVLCAAVSVCSVLPVRDKVRLNI